MTKPATKTSFPQNSGNRSIAVANTGNTTANRVSGSIARLRGSSARAHAAKNTMPTTSVAMSNSPLLTPATSQSWAVNPRRKGNTKTPNSRDLQRPCVISVEIENAASWEAGIPELSAGRTLSRYAMPMSATAVSPILTYRAHPEPTACEARNNPWAPAYESGTSTMAPRQSVHTCPLPLALQAES